MRAVLLVLVASGCAQVLGLDDTRLDTGGPDAAPDAGGVCGGLPAACTSSSTGRSICGQLFLPGGEPLRAPDPAGLTCLPGGTGPCQLRVSALGYESYLMAIETEGVPGSIDDCGRWVVPDVDPAIADVAVVFDSPDHLQTASLVRGRANTPGLDVDVRGLAVSTETAAGWVTQIGDPDGTPITTGFLVDYRRGTALPGTPSEMIQVARNASNPITDRPPLRPGVAYFEGTAPFGVISAPQTATGPSGTAYTVLEDGQTLSVEGIRPGVRCREMGLHQVPGALIYLAILRC